MLLAWSTYVNIYFPLVTGMANEMKVQLSATAEMNLEIKLVYSSVTYLQRLALEPQEPASFCLRVKNGLVWDEGCFCFILLYKQKHSLISLLKG